MKSDSLIAYPCSKILKRALEIAPKIKLKTEATLIYKGQVPNFAILLLKGHLYIHKSGSYNESPIKKSCLVGYRQLAGKQAFQANVSILPGAEVSFLDSRDVSLLEKFNCLTLESKS